MLNRRAFLCQTIAAALAVPLAAEAQRPAKAARLGVLCSITFREAFAEGLRELGYVYHRNFVIESHDVAEGDLLESRLNSLGSQLTSSSHAPRRRQTL